MYRGRILLAVGLAATVSMAGCTDDATSTTAETSGSESGTGGDGDGDGDPATGDGDGDGECVPGTQGCPCDLGSTCAEGLACVEGECVEAGECGDGVVDPGEECDDGNEDNSDSCVEGCVEASCGDGFVGPGEGCDDGNDIDDDACTNDCALVSCGDGVVQEGEECDDGNTDDSDGCLNTCVAASCGDGVVYADVEECDDGNEVDTDACLNTCVAAVCGDGVVYADVEECDDGNEDNSDTCVEGCVAASCGDGYVGPGEGCDDGNDIDDDACTNDCALPGCGDMILQPGEACDDGNDDNTDACLNTCVEASCSDGFVWAGTEDCDDGNVDNTDACLDTCVDASCGDGFVWVGNEVCDDQNEDNTDACLDTCESASCGDGFVWAGNEACDDQNEDNTDACLDTCESASCGDGFVWEGTEDCDDGDMDDTDACPSTCADASCGDGFVWDGNEACDDGNMTDNDGCDSDCTGSVGVQKLVGGRLNSCALSWAGEVKCWGFGGAGALGYGNTEDIGDNELPASVGNVDIGGVVVDIAAGSDHYCVILEDQSMKCWGRGVTGGLGYGNNQPIGDNELPSAVGAVDFGGGVVTHMALGADFTCILLEGGAVRCWGDNQVGSLGQGNTENIGDNELPSSIGPVDVGGSAVALTAGGKHACVLTEDDELRCWGWGTSGQLGLGNANTIGDDELPSSVGPVSHGVGAIVEIDCGDLHTCIRGQDGGVKCWGFGSAGRLGLGNSDTIGNDEVPFGFGPISLGGAAVAIDAGWITTCALDGGGEVRCWGQGSQGGLGYGNTNTIGDNELPSSVGTVDVGAPVKALSSGNGQNKTCVLTQAGGVRCWGWNHRGQLGQGNTNNIGDNEAPSVLADVPLGW